MWLNKGHSFWDQNLLKQLLEDLPETERQVVVVPGTINTPAEVNEELAKYPKVLVIITSDEENLFPISELNHPDMVSYVTYPNLDKHKNVDRFLPIGYPPIPTMELTAKKLPWFFSGQINHPSREKLAKILRGMSLGKLIETEGFGQGLEKSEYYQQMVYANVVPAPGGPHSPDSFRLYEALESGAIPIPDHPEFWNMLFPDHPFPALANWDTLPDLVNNLKDRPEENNRCQAWWLRQKRELRWMIEDDLDISPGKITVLIPTSPIESHPSTEIIEETIKSVRERLPDSEIILMIDGVRDEQKDKTANYNEYIRRLLWQCNRDNLYPLLFSDHQHQANMAREALRHVRTPHILYVEHDTPLTGDIPFQDMAEALDSGKVNLIRFHYEAQVHPEHKHLMLDETPQLINNVPLLRCAQWSQRPHLARADFYWQILESYFPPTARTMIEDRIYGELENAWFNRGVSGWNDFKVWMYAPEGDIKRSLNLDGRGTESKYEMFFQ